MVFLWFSYAFLAFYLFLLCFGGNTSRVAIITVGPACSSILFRMHVFFGPWLPQPCFLWPHIQILCAISHLGQDSEVWNRKSGSPKTEMISFLIRWWVWTPVAKLYICWPCKGIFGGMLGDVWGGLATIQGSKTQCKKQTNTTHNLPTKCVKAYAKLGDPTIYYFRGSFLLFVATYRCTPYSLNSLFGELFKDLGQDVWRGFWPDALPDLWSDS